MQAIRNPRISNTTDLEIDIEKISEGQKIIVTYTIDVPAVVVDVGTCWWRYTF